MTQLGQELELAVTDLNVDGGAVARHEGRVVFLDRGLPGERVLARISGEKKRLLLAEVLATLAPSPEEVEPFCRYFGRCGGCSMQNYNYAAQLELKRRQAAQVFARIGGLDSLPGSVPACTPGSISGPLGDGLPPIIASPKLREYRNKMEYAFGQDEGGGLALGLRRRASHEVLDIERCPLQSEASGRVLGSVREWAKRHGLAAWREMPARAGKARVDGTAREFDLDAGAPGSELHGRAMPARDKEGGSAAASAADGGKTSAPGGCLRYLVLREPEFHPEGRAQLVVELICGAALPPKAAVDELWQLLRDCGATSFILSKRRSRLSLARGERVFRVYGNRTLWERFGDLQLEYPVSGFSQTNTGAASLLYAQAVSFAFGGSGSGSVRVPAPDACTAAVSEADGESGAQKEPGLPERGGEAEKLATPGKAGNGGSINSSEADSGAGAAFSELWDLYCGVGALALSLAVHGGAGRILGVELDGEAVKLARANADRLGLKHCAFAAADVATLMESLEWPKNRPRLLPGGFIGPDLLVADPPRSGLSPKVLQSVRRVRPRVIVYVSCDLSTQARDVGQLADLYRVERLTLVDMFPHTQHVESVCRLVLRD